MPYRILARVSFAVDSFGMAAVCDDVKQVLDVQYCGDHGVWESLNYVCPFLE